MSRSLNNIKLNNSLILGPVNDVSLSNNNGVLSIQTSVTSFDINSTLNTGPAGVNGFTGSNGPTGSALNTEIVTGTTLDPSVGVSILRGGISYTLPNASTDGLIKYIVDDVDRNYALRCAIWDGTSFSALNSGSTLFTNGIRANIANTNVSASCVDSDGNAIVGGSNFTIAGGTAANRIARWNGTTWTTLGTGLSDTVSALIIDSDGSVGPTGNLYAGGAFTTAGGTGANRIARWDGSTWFPLGTGMVGPVSTLTIDPLGSIGPTGNLYAGGGFSSAGGTAANSVARWNGTTWSPLGGGLGSNVNTLVIDPVGSIGPTGNLYAGGIFTTAGGTAANFIARWNGTTWFPLGTGLGSTVTSLVIDTMGVVGPIGNLYAGGSFTSAGGTAANRIARWNGSIWSPLGTGIGSVGNAVNTILIDNIGSIGPTGNLYAGGSFVTAGGTAANSIARWDGTGWYPLATGVNSSVNSLILYDNKLLLTGSFTILRGSQPTISVSGNFYSPSSNAFYSAIRTTNSNLGKQQGLVWLNNVGAWSIINNNEIFTYV